MTDDIAIRPITDDDVESVVVLWEACGLTRPWNDPRDDIARARGSLEAVILVAERDGEVVGTVMVGHDGHRAWMYYVAVAPALQGTGLGRQLVKAAEVWAAATGMQKMHLLIRPENGKVRGFYESIGYAEQPRVMMAKWLDGRPLDP
ncbi:GNAT family acetyltransferase [Zavarzinia aquatilis]|uniref:GNAT family acetyltransferase n=1 Tax=Zavarzinia aquatilis TaxID=2211142 RepID=A0A317E8G7_9PROT|nr:GNAT family acetyltransferase [Zavarzinia aquatilis]PWR22832.1 GNAT family acetyltransferase [Zavarzinia aquatilis]